MKYVVVIAALCGVAASAAHSAPINLCIYNNNNQTVWVSLRFPGAAMSNFTLSPRSMERRQGDSAGLECSDFQPFTNVQCPNPKSQNDFRCN